MNVLYLGDIMGEPGIRLVEEYLPRLRAERKVDLVLAQSENVSEGKGMLPADMKRLQKVGVDFFTGGNHTPVYEKLHPALSDPAQPVIGPANMPDCPGPGWKFINTPKGRVLVISLLGSTVGKVIASDNPLHAIDKILGETRDEKRIATVVNFHGDFSSEKVIIGHYLDGKVSTVVGDHWHVPTADADILPKGTAHITDVGMCGILDSSLGVTFGSVIPRWRDGVVTKNELETKGRRQLNALLVGIDEATALATACQHIRMVITQ